MTLLWHKIFIECGRFQENEVQIQQAGTYTAIRNKSKRDSHYQQVIRHQSKQLESGNFYKFSGRTVYNSYQQKTSTYLKLILNNLQVAITPKMQEFVLAKVPTPIWAPPKLQWNGHGIFRGIISEKNMPIHGGCNVLVHQSCERRIGGLVCYISLLETHRS